MSGHSKWHSIRHKKAATDAKRGKIFTKHASLIAIAAKEGGSDIDMNAGLRLAIDNAKKDNMPNNNIERAIKRGTGELNDGKEICENTYEAYGPEGSALIIQCVTDNKNRTVSEVKSTLTKNGGNMGTSGSVAWMFDYQGLIIVNPGDTDADSVELDLIDAGADDVRKEDDVFEVYTKKEDLNATKEALVAKGYDINSAALTYRANNVVHIDAADKAKKILNLIDKLEDLDDVTNVYSNVDIPEDILSSLS